MPASGGAHTFLHKSRSDHPTVAVALKPLPNSVVYPPKAAPHATRDFRSPRVWEFFCLHSSANLCLGLQASKRGTRGGATPQPASGGQAKEFGEGWPQKAQDAQEKGGAVLHILRFLRLLWPPALARDGMPAGSSRLKIENQESPIAADQSIWQKDRGRKISGRWAGESFCLHLSANLCFGRQAFKPRPPHATVAMVATAKPQPLHGYV